jgi:membrane fusion protein
MNRVVFRKAAIAAQADTLYGAPLVAQTPRLAILVFALVLVSMLLLGFAHGPSTPARNMSSATSRRPAASSRCSRRWRHGAGAARQRRPGREAGDVLLVVLERALERRDARHAGAGPAPAERAARKPAPRAGKSKPRSTRCRPARSRSASRASARRSSRCARRSSCSAAAWRAPRLTIKRHEGLVASHFISEAALQQKQDELLDQRGQLASLNRTVAGLTRDLDAAAAELAASGSSAPTARPRSGARCPSSRSSSPKPTAAAWSC